MALLRDDGLFAAFVIGIMIGGVVMRGLIWVVA